MTHRYRLTILLIGSLLALGCARQHTVTRYGSVTGVKPEKIAYYKELHANPWPGVMKKIDECNIRNYSIYLGEIEPGKFYLFSYFEYIGKDFDADMAKMAEDETTRRWWQETDPCQQPVPMKKDEGIWMGLEEVFYHTAP